MKEISSSPTSVMSCPFGKYSRRSPFVFSFVPPVPRMVWQRKIELDAKVPCQFLMVRELFASVRRYGKQWLSFKHFQDPLPNRRGTLRLRLAAEQEPCLPVNHRDEACLALCTYHGVSFPMAPAGPLFGGDGSFVYQMGNPYLASGLHGAFPMPCLALVSPRLPWERGSRSKRCR